MVEEFVNSIDDADDDGFGRYEGAGPYSAPDSDARSDNSDDGDDEENLKEDPEEDSNQTETQEKGVVREGQIAWKAMN